MSAIAYCCDCQGNGHKSGCGLSLRLLVKYGDEKLGIIGVCKRFNILNCMTDEANFEMDRLVNKYIDIWTNKNEGLVIKELQKLFGNDI